jgi:hypothetical protein
MLDRFANGMPRTTAEDAIAEPGEPWTATDTPGPGKPPPARHFLLGARNRETLFVWYESGGIARFLHVALFAREGSGWRFVGHVADGTAERICARLKQNDSSVYDRFW